MADKITRFNLHEFSIATQMEYRKARRAEAREIAERNAQFANSFASIKGNQAVGEGNIFSRIAMERMAGQRVSKKV